MSTHQHSGFVPDPSWPSILELAIKLWGQPTDWSHNRDEARFGSKGSKSIRLSDQTWFSRGRRRLCRSASEGNRPAAETAGAHQRR